LQYLQTPDYFPPNWLEATADLREHRLLQDAMRALRELIDVSFEVYLQGLASPAVQATVFPKLPNCRFYKGYADIWLNSATEYLLRERRWKDAIKYLETLVLEWIKRCTPNLTRELLLDRQGEREWYLAMAYWGDTGNLRSDLSLQATEHLSQAAERYAPFGAENCQRLSLLYWSIGDTDRASSFLDRALEESSKRGLHRGVSNWTFREASVHEFRQHCEEQRRMIQGEPVRPAFLGEPAALDQGGGNGH
jgi:tetratricopeptide (TPR) repeat protein